MHPDNTYILLDYRWVFLQVVPYFDEHVGVTWYLRIADGQ